MPGLALIERDELLDRARRHRRVDRENNGGVDRERDRVEILVGIERDFVVQGGIDDIRRGDEQNGISVGRRLCGAAHADVAAATGNVLDVELLSGQLGQLERDQAGDHVCRTAGGVGNDHAHGSIGVALRPCSRRHGEADDRGAGGLQETTADRFHGISPSERLIAHARRRRPKIRRRPPTSMVREPVFLSAIAPADGTGAAAKGTSAGPAGSSRTNSRSVPARYRFDASVGRGCVVQDPRGPGAWSRSSMAGSRCSMSRLSRYGIRNQWTPRARSAPSLKKIDYDMKLSLDPVGESCIRYVALLIEGRLRRQSRWRSQAWRPAAAACNRRLGRQGTPPARHYDLAARSVAARMRRKCRKRKRGPGPKSPRWSAERRASPRHGGAGAFVKAPRRAASMRHVAGARHAPERLSALRHPSIGVGSRRSNPGRERAAGTKEAVRWRERAGRQAAGRQAATRARR